MSGRNDEDSPPEKPWLWIRVEIGSRCEHWQTVGVRSTGGEIISKLKIKKTSELGNTPSFLSLGIKESKSHRNIVAWDYNRRVHNSSVKPGAKGVFHNITTSEDLIAEVTF